MLRLEINGGYFDRGYNEFQDVQNEKVRLFGASVQPSLHHGMPLRSSVDDRLYKSNRESVSGQFSPERYPGGLAWLVQSEFTVLGNIDTLITILPAGERAIAQIAEGHREGRFRQDFLGVTRGVLQPRRQPDAL